MVLTYLTIGSTTKMLKTTATQRAQNYSFSHSSDKVMDKYIRNIRAINKATAYKYHFRLTTFQNFITNDYKTTLDNLIMEIREHREDPYDILSNYVIYLQNNSSISPATLKARIITAKNFLEYHDVDMSPRKSKLRVKIPKVMRKSKEALSKEDITDILNVCSDIRLKHILCY